MTSFALKIIAVAAMILDHIAIVFCLPADIVLGGQSFSVLRVVGRLAFPIYAFLITEGLMHTSNWKKYAGRLLALAVISELPYDLAIYGTVCWEAQNVFFTLVLGMLVIQLDLFFRVRGNQWYGVGILGIFCVLSWQLGTDYDALGILMIYCFYYMKNNKFWMLTAVSALNVLGGPVQMFGCLACIPIGMYNGRLGFRKKWIQYGFYLIYPVHLGVLYWLSRA